MAQVLLMGEYPGQMELSGDWPVLDALIRREVGLPGGAWRPEDIARLLDRKISRIYASLERLEELGLCVGRGSSSGVLNVLSLTPSGYADWVALYAPTALPCFERLRETAIRLAAPTPGRMGRIDELAQQLEQQGCVLDVEGMFVHLWVMRGLGELEVSQMSPSFYELRANGLRGLLYPS